MQLSTRHCKGKDVYTQKTVVLTQSQHVFHDSEWEIVNSNIIIRKFRLLEDLFVLKTS